MQIEYQRAAFKRPPVIKEWFVRPLLGGIIACPGRTLFIPPAGLVVTPCGSDWLNDKGR